MHNTAPYNPIRPSRFSVALLLAISLAATSPVLAAGEHDGEHDNNGGGHTFAFGAPADASEADRTITITARDNMTFESDSISIEKGTTIQIVIDNVGQFQHSFTLAEPVEQRAHEKEMQGMSMDRMAGHMDDDPNGIVVQPGETGSVTWRFTEATTVRSACHIPGHYPAG